MPRAPKKPVKPHPVWLCVFELADQAVPRRFPDKPHVRVEQKVIKPGPDLDSWLKRAKAKKRPELVRVLSSKMPQAHEPGGLRYRAVRHGLRSGPGGVVWCVSGRRFAPPSDTPSGLFPNALMCPATENGTVSQ